MRAARGGRWGAAVLLGACVPMLLAAIGCGGGGASAASPLGVRLVRDPQTHILYYVVTNQGSAPARNVTFHYQPDDPLAPGAVASNGGGACEVESGAESCRVDTLPGGKSVTFEVIPSSAEADTHAVAGGATPGEPGGRTAGERAEGKVAVAGDVDGAQRTATPQPSSEAVGSPGVVISSPTAFGPSIRPTERVDALTKALVLTLKNIGDAPARNVSVALTGALRFTANGRLSPVRDLRSVVDLRGLTTSHGRVQQLLIPSAQRISRLVTVDNGKAPDRTQPTWYVGTLDPGQSESITIDAGPKTGTPVILVARYQGDNIASGLIRLPLRQLMVLPTTASPRPAASPSTSSSPAPPASASTSTRTTTVTSSTTTTSRPATTTAATPTSTRTTTSTGPSPSPTPERR